MDAAPTVVPEPGHARPEGAVPDRAGARRAPAAPARAAAARAGLVGAGRRPRAERVPGGGARRPPAVGALPRPAPAPAGVAPGRGGQGRPVRRAGRRRALLRALAALGARLVARARAGAGGRRDRPPRGRGGAGGQRALPRLGHPGRLGGPARQRAGAMAGTDPAPAAPVAPGRACGLDGLGAGRPGPGGPRVVEARPRPRLAPAAAHPAADHDHPRRSGALPGRGPGPARRSLGRPRPARLAEEPAPDRHPGRGVDERHQDEPWLVVTDLPPDRVGVSWYALRAWVELGFRALKGVGWQWQRSRRTDPARVARHWLVLAVASLWVLAHGTRVEDARERGRPPARLRAPPVPPARAPPPPLSPGALARPRRISLFRLGIQRLRHPLARGWLWRRLWLAPEPWPQPPPGLAITVHGQ